MVGEHDEDSVFIGPKFDYCLALLSHGFVKIDTWISLCCYMDFSKLIHGFNEIVTWICQSCNVDLVNLLHGCFCRQAGLTKSC